MKLIESKARSKALFAVCYLSSNDMSRRASDIAKISDQDASNVSRYCNEWCEKGTLQKDKEGKYVSFHVSETALAQSLFDYIADDLKDQCGFETVEDLKNTDEEEIKQISASLGKGRLANNASDRIMNKIHMVDYFFTKELTHDTEFPKELGDTLKLLFSQPSVSTMDTAENVINTLKQHIGGKEVEVVEKLMSLVKVNEEPLGEVKTVSDGFEEAIDVMLFLAGTDAHESISKDERIFLENLRMYRVGIQLQL